MKRLITIVLTLVLTLTMSVPVFAADDVTEPSEHEHVWSGWAVEHPATCENTGVEIRYCVIDKCYETEQRSTPALGHVWSGWNVAAAATIFSDGYQQQTCTRCGAINTSAVTKLTPFVSWADKVSKLPLKQKHTFVLNLANGDYVTKWKSSKKKIASVNADGVVKAKKKGTTTITAYTASGMKISCKVKVVKAKKKAAKAKKGKKGKGGTVYWTPSGSVYHYSRGCRSLARSRTVYSGSIEESGRPRACKNCG